MTSTQDKLNGLLVPVVEALGCELWGLDYSTQARHATLRVYIEKEGGVGLEDCEKVSRQISSVMDVEDPISTQYTLEVSSPGIERPLYTLDHYKRSIGQVVAIKLSRKFEERKNIKGVIAGVESDEVIVQVGDEEYLLPIELIEKASIVATF